jgi:hypothetical protein
MKTSGVYSPWARMVGPCLHTLVPPYPGPPNVPGVELFHRMKYLSSSDMTDDGGKPVLFDGWGTALDGHDAGAGIIHVLVPPNLGIALAILFSKYKIPFSASTVMAKGKAVATHFPFIMPPLFCCNPCAMPAMIVNQLVMDNFTVYINTTFGDWLRGLESIAYEMATDALFNKLFKKYDKIFSPFSKAAKEAAEKAGQAAAASAKEAAKAFVQKLLEKFFQGAVKNAAKSAGKAADGKPEVPKVPVYNKPWNQPWKAK